MALSSPPTELQLKALKLDLDQVTPLLAPYPDMAAEHQELLDLVDRLPSEKPIQQRGVRQRMIELGDLLRVQLAAAQ